MLHPAEYYRNVSCIYQHAAVTVASVVATSQISMSSMVNDVLRCIDCTVFSPTDFRCIDCRVYDPSDCK